MGFSPFSDVSVGVAGTAGKRHNGTGGPTNPGNAEIINEIAGEAYATASLAQNVVSEYLLLTNFTFYPAIPTGATILGIRVQVNRRAVTTNTVMVWNSAARDETTEAHSLTRMSIHLAEQ